MAPDIAPYVALLDPALADLKLTADERSELSTFAADLGLSALHVQRARRAFLDGLVEAALADGKVTDEVINQLCRSAALLELDIDCATKHTDAYRTIKGSLALTPGLSVCFTCSATDPHGNEIERSELESIAQRRGLVVKDPVSAKCCALLVAADTSTGSGKADQARRFGIPVVSVGGFLSSLGSAQALPSFGWRQPAWR